MSTEETSSLRNASASAISWSYVAVIFRYGGTLFVSTALAQLLMPEDFGLFALTLPVTGFAALFTDMGFSASIVQREDLTDRMLNSIFWTAGGIGLVLGIVVAVLAVPLSYFFEHPDFWWVLILASSTFIFSTLAIVPCALLKRQLKLREFSFTDIGGFFIGSIAAVTLAFFDYGVLALVSQAVLPHAGKVIIGFVLASWQPRLVHNWSDIKTIAKFSSNYTNFSIATFFTKNIDKVIIGYWFPMSALGLYNRAYAYTNLPTSMIAGVVSTAIFPVMAKVRCERDRFNEIFLLINELVIAVVMPLFVGLWVLKFEFIYVVLGEQWLGMTPLLEVFIIIGLIQSVNSLTSVIFLTQEKMHSLFLLALYSSVVSSASYIVGALLGEIEYVAYSYLVVYIVLIVPPTFILPFRIIGLSFSNFFKRQLKVLIAGISMGIVVFLIRQLMLTHYSSFQILVALTLFGGLFYAVTIWLLNPKVLTVALEYAQDKFPRLGFVKYLKR